MNTATPLTKYTAIEENRSQVSCDIEAINHMITLWFMQHKGCTDEIKQYNTALDQLYTIAGEDDLAASYLQCQLAKDWFRSLYGHDWSR